MPPVIRKVLVIRQDNIGDLVCTTPLLSGLHEQFPTIHLTALCTSYNRPVLDRNPHLSEVVSYAKQSHHNSVAQLLVGSLQKLLMIAHLRRRRFDVVVAPSTPCSPRLKNLVKLIKPGLFIRSEKAATDGGNVPEGELKNKHEVERVWELGRRLGLEGRPPAVKVYPDETARDLLRKQILARLGRPATTRILAVHISSRKESQQWPVDSFGAMIRQLNQLDPSLAFLLLWAPGPAASRAHAGDDDKLAELQLRLGSELPVFAQPTPDLASTISALAASDLFIGSDGGAMHLAAACGLPIVAFFGNSSVRRWGPWISNHEVLQPATKEVRDIAPEEAVAAYARLLSRLRHG